MIDLVKDLPVLGLKGPGQGEVVLVQPLVHVLELSLKTVALHQALNASSLGIFDEHDLGAGQRGLELLQSVEDELGDVGGATLFDGEDQGLQSFDSLPEARTAAFVVLHVADHAVKPLTHIQNEIQHTQTISHSKLHDDVLWRRR